MTVADVKGGAERPRGDRLGQMTDQHPVWARWMALFILGLGLLRVGVLALDLTPLHFDEAQYWSYGEALDFGYYSKPPMTAWLIRLSTELLGDTAFAVRVLSPWIHGLIAWLIFATARRLFDARTGFWAGAAYLLLPGVVVSSTIMSTDPPMMAAWAGALYALVRIFEKEDAGESALLWWAICGVAIGLGLNSKYTIIAFVGGGLGYALFSREGARRARAAGPLLAAAAALLVWAPNLWWNAQNGFASIAHVAENANLSDGPALNPLKALEFFGSQFGVFGPVLMIAALWMVGSFRRWRHEWSYRLLLWMSLPLIIAMTVQGLLSRAHPNWAAPSYVALTIATVAWLLDQKARRWLIATLAVGVITLVGYAGLGLAYQTSPTTLPRFFDPFKKMRPEYLICERAIPHLREGERMFSTSRRILGVCMFYAERGPDDIRIQARVPPANHYQLAVPLDIGSDEEMLAILSTDRTDELRDSFERVEFLEIGAFASHGPRKDRPPRLVRYGVARVSGYLGPPSDDDEE